MYTREDLAAGVSRAGEGRCMDEWPPGAERWPAGSPDGGAALAGAVNGQGLGVGGDGEGEEAQVRSSFSERSRGSHLSLKFRSVRWDISHFSWVFRSLTESLLRVDPLSY
jgi:hypothetical protein